MFSFSGEVVWPIAIAEVPVRIGEVQKMVEFNVMDTDPPYNAIIGRTWLGMMKAVASPYHQKLKLQSKEGIVVVRGKQENARHCFRLAVQSAMAEKKDAEVAENVPKVGKKNKKKMADEIKAFSFKSMDSIISLSL